MSELDTLCLILVTCPSCNKQIQSRRLKLNILISCIGSKHGFNYILNKLENMAIYRVTEYQLVFLSIVGFMRLEVSE